jgi:hypothetical protein
MYQLWKKWPHYANRFKGWDSDGLIVYLLMLRMNCQSYNFLQLIISINAIFVMSWTCCWGFQSGWGWWVFVGDKST